MSNAERKGLPLLCPFCGGEPISDTGFMWCLCTRCGAQGPVAQTEQDAFAAWNRRAVLAEPDRIGELEASQGRDRSFVQGILCACTTVVRIFDRPEISKQILIDASITEQDILASRMSDFDTEPALSVIDRAEASR